MTVHDLRLVIANFLVFATLLVAVWAWPSGRLVLVVTDPRHGQDAGMAAIAGAGGSFVSGTGTAWMAVAYSDEENFPARLMRAGALLVLNHRLAAGCLRETP